MVSPMKHLLIVGLLLAAFFVHAANPAFTDFNTNQFDVTGRMVTIKSNAAVTNLTVVYPLDDSIVISTNAAKNTYGVRSINTNAFAKSNIFVGTTIAGVMSTNGAGTEVLVTNIPLSQFNWETFATNANGVLYGQVILHRANGYDRIFIPTANTDAARGVAFERAVVTATAGDSITLGEGTYGSLTNTSVNVPLEFRAGAMLKPGFAVTVLLNAPISAPKTKIFDQSAFGLVKPNTVLIRELYPEWWGAFCDGITDDTAAVSNCVYAALTDSATVILSGYYLVTDTIIVNGQNTQNWPAIQGYTPAGNAACGFLWAGSTSGTCLNVSQVSYRIFKNFAVVSTVARGTSIGMLLNGPNNTGTQGSLDVFDHILISGFATNLVIGQFTDKANSELTFSSLDCKSANVGIASGGFNTLDLYFDGLNFANCVKGLDPQVSNFHIRNGSGGNNGWTFYIAPNINGNNYSIDDWRDEGSTNGALYAFIGQISKVSLNHLNVASTRNPSNVVIQVYPRGTDITIDNSQINGGIVVPSMQGYVNTNATHVAAAGSITIRNTTLWGPTNSILGGVIQDYPFVVGGDDTLNHNARYYVKDVNWTTNLNASGVLQYVDRKGQWAHSGDFPEVISDFQNQKFTVSGMTMYLSNDLHIVQGDATVDGAVTGASFSGNALNLSNAVDIIAGANITVTSNANKRTFTIAGTAGGLTNGSSPIFNNLTATGTVTATTFNASNLNATTFIFNSAYGNLFHATNLLWVSLNIDPSRTTDNGNTVGMTNLADASGWCWTETTKVWHNAGAVSSLSGFYGDASHLTNLFAGNWKLYDGGNQVNVSNISSHAVGLLAMSSNSFGGANKIIVSENGNAGVKASSVQIDSSANVTGVADFSADTIFSASGSKLNGTTVFGDAVVQTNTTAINYWSGASNHFLGALTTPGVNLGGVYRTSWPSGSGDVIASGTLTADRIIAGNGSSSVKATSVTLDGSGNMSNVGDFQADTVTATTEFRGPAGANLTNLFLNFQLGTFSGPTNTLPIGTPCDYTASANVSVTGLSGTLLANHMQFAMLRVLNTSGSDKTVTLPATMYIVGGLGHTLTMTNGTLTEISIARTAAITNATIVTFAQ